MAPRDEAPGELDRLRHQVQGDWQLLDRLSTVGLSSATAVLIEQTRGRYEQNLHRSCEILKALLENAEERIGELEQRNRALQEANEQLTYKADKLRLELRQALGVASTAVRSFGIPMQSASRWLSPDRIWRHT